MPEKREKMLEGSPGSSQPGTFWNLQDNRRGSESTAVRQRAQPDGRELTGPGQPGSLSRIPWRVTECVGRFKDIVSQPVGSDL